MKILVSDFDRTFYDENYQENIEMVKKFREKNNIFIIATGRNLDSLFKVLKNNYFDYLICNDGAIIFDKNLNIIYQKNIEKLVGKEVYEKYKDLEIYLNDGRNVTNDYNNINKIDIRYYDFKKANKVLNEITKKSCLKGYLSNLWININDINTSKGEAIKFLADKNNWSKKSIYTIGDNVNDISMNEMFNGYCVENSSELLENISLGKFSSLAELIKKII